MKLADRFLRWEWFWKKLYPKVQNHLATILCRDGHSWKGYQYHDGSWYHLCQKCTKEFK